MSRLGEADMGIATLNDMVANAAMIASLDPSVPLIADADTGYGGAIMVGRTVSSYIRAGVSRIRSLTSVVVI
jgi:2-methylisocitrate lyase-like PEP mutase family enzyme